MYDDNSLPIHEYLPSLSPLIKWNHKQYPLLSYNVLQDIKGEYQIVQMIDKKYMEYIKGHIIDG